MLLTWPPDQTRQHQEQRRGLGVIRHIVFFSAKRQEDVDEIVEGLQSLAGIPFSTSFEVARNRKVDSLANDIDVIVYAEFPDEAALAAYKEHPLYAESIRRVRPLRNIRHSADIVSSRGKSTPAT